jgi:cytoskeleton protein RodZ
LNSKRFEPGNRMAQRRANLFHKQTPEPDDIRQVGGGVGGLLRRRREEIQQDIEEVSRQLRIRSPYIRAIEEGKFHELPGSAYAVGFVRAYADYLGLDGESIVGDYRDELARRSRQNDLVWPSEGTESRFPGGTILVVCVLLGLAIYGGWFYATQSGTSGIKLIDQVPAYIKNATGIGGQTADSNTPTTQPEGSKTEAQAAPAPAASSPPSSAAPLNAAPMTAPAADAGTPPAAPSSTPPAVIATPAPSATAPAVVLGQGSQNTQTATPAPAAPTPPAPAATETAPAAPTTDQTASASAAAPAIAPAAKVVIRANRDSWIEIRDKDDNVVLQKVLRQGESFNVPDQKGMLMTTGNAGGIVIELEGKALQSLGSLGVVKRGVKLDPAALSDGSAFQTDDNQ